MNNIGTEQSIDEEHYKLDDFRILLQDSTNDETSTNVLEMHLFFTILSIRYHCMIIQRKSSKIMRFFLSIDEIYCTCALDSSRQHAPSVYLNCIFLCFIYSVIEELSLFHCFIVIECYDSC